MKQCSDFITCRSEKVSTNDGESRKEKMCDFVPFSQRSCSSAVPLFGTGERAAERAWFMCLSVSHLFRITVQGKQQG